MGKKEFGVNTKKEEAKERKETHKKEKKEKDERVKEDSKWADNDKKVAKKIDKDVDSYHAARRKRKTRSQAKSQGWKESASRGWRGWNEQEYLDLIIEKNPPVPKKTKFEIDKFKEKLEDEAEKKHEKLEAQKVRCSDKNMIAETKDDDDSSDYEKNLEINWNHVWREQQQEDLEKYGEVIEATGVDDFLAQTDKSGKPIDLHPEKRMKASWQCFVDERMDKMKKENPSLKRSQILQMLSKEVNFANSSGKHTLKIRSSKPRRKGQPSEHGKMLRTNPRRMNN